MCDYFPKQAHVDSGRRVRGRLVLHGSTGEINQASQMQVSSLWPPGMG